MLFGSSRTYFMHRLSMRLDSEDPPPALFAERPGGVWSTGTGSCAELHRGCIWMRRFCPASVIRMKNIEIVWFLDRPTRWHGLSALHLLYSARHCVDAGEKYWKCYVSGDVSPGADELTYILNIFSNVWRVCRIGKIRSSCSKMFRRQFIRSCYFFDSISLDVFLSVLLQQFFRSINASRRCFQHTFERTWRKCFRKTTNLLESVCGQGCLTSN